MLESGWEELGMDDQWAARVATEMADDDNPALPIDFYKVRCGSCVCGLNYGSDPCVGRCPAGNMMYRCVLVVYWFWTLAKKDACKLEM